MPNDENRTGWQNIVDLIEGAITGLGEDAEDSRLTSDELGVAWRFRRGSADVLIFLSAPEEAGDDGHLQVVAPVSYLPEDAAQQAALLRRLLELNAEELNGAAFGLRGDTAVVTTDRTTADIDGSEVREMVHRVGFYADTWDDLLVSEYGGERYTDRAEG